jgi:hypothetical protein
MAKSKTVKAEEVSQNPNQPKEELENEDESAQSEPESDADDEPEVVVTAPPPAAPPVSNANVEPGAEQFGDTEPAEGTEPVEEPPAKRPIRDRIKDIETRWEKDFEEIMIDLHDHVFGTSPTHEETTAKREQAAKDAEAKDTPQS